MNSPFLFEWSHTLPIVSTARPSMANIFEPIVQSHCVQRLVGGLLVSNLNFNAPIKYRCAVNEIDSHAMSLVKCSLRYLIIRRLFVHAKGLIRMLIPSLLRCFLLWGFMQIYNMSFQWWAIIMVIDFRFLPRLCMFS